MHNTVRYTLISNLLIPERRDLSSFLCCGKSYHTLSHDGDQRPERPGKQGPVRKTYRTNTWCLLSLCSAVSPGKWPREIVFACAPHLSSLFFSHSLPLPSPLSFSSCLYLHSVPHTPSLLFSPPFLLLCISFSLIHALSLSFPMYECRFLKTGSRTAKDYAKLDF